MTQHLQSTNNIYIKNHDIKCLQIPWFPPKNITPFFTSHKHQHIIFFMKWAIIAPQIQIFTNWFINLHYPETEK